MLEKIWSIYLKFAAIAPLLGIVYLWRWLDGEHISLMGFVGSSSQILVVIALIALMAAAYPAGMTAVFILFPHKTRITNVILFGLRRLPWPRLRRRRISDNARVIFWILVTLALPSMLGMLMAEYFPGRNGYWWLLGIGILPSVCVWLLLRRYGALKRFKSIQTLFCLMIIAFSTCSIGFVLFLTAKFHIPYVYYPYGKRMAHLQELVVYHGEMVSLIVVFSLFSAWMFAPTKGTEKGLKIKIFGASFAIVVASFLGFTPVNVVMDAFALFASGGEHRIYRSLTGKHLEIPASACADDACITSKDIWVAADLGGTLYGWFDFTLPNGKGHTMRLRKIETTGTTYEVTKTDLRSLSNLQNL
jgi:hypothetical protein